MNRRTLLSLEGIRLALGRIGLPAWFITIDLVWRIPNPQAFAIDARHYQLATAEWLRGGDPWGLADQGVFYASGPHTLLFYTPTAFLPLWLSTSLWMAAGLAAGIWLVRRLGLPLWWLLFPPLFHGMWNGNPQPIVVALLVFGGPLAATVAVGMKLYAALPLMFSRWRDVIIAGAVLALTLPLLPWQLFLGQEAVSEHLSSSWNGSAWRLPILIPPTLIALWILRRHGGEWLAVPAVWPGTQLYYNSTALPALVDRPWLAAAIALPAPLGAPLAVIAFAVVVARRGQAGSTADGWRQRLGILGRP